VTHIPYNHPAAIDPQQLLTQCDTQRSRGSGPGGQHRNKVETAITLLHRPTGTTGSAQERRSQAQNLNNALARLRLNLALCVRQPLTLPHTPSPLWRSRLTARRIAINPKHTDFPAILAEALDLLSALNHDPKTTAKTLDCSVSQLIKLLKKEPRSLARVNQNRTSAGLHLLK